MSTAHPRRRFRAAITVFAVSAALTLTGAGVAQAVSVGDPGDSPIGNDNESPLSNLPIIGSNDPNACSITSSDPKSRKVCNHYGHNGKDGKDGSVRGEPEHHGKKYSRNEDGDDRSGDDDYWSSRDDDDQYLGPDVNGAPGGRGVPRADNTPGWAGN